MGQGRWHEDRPSTEYSQDAWLSRQTQGGHILTRTKSIIIAGLISGILILLVLWSVRLSSELSEDKFVKVYVQLSIARETLAPDTLKLQEEKDSIFRQAGVSREELDHFIAQCHQNPQRWIRIWKRIVEQLEKSSALKTPSKTGNLK
ncbi:MAG: hypothetical protein WCE90_06725 [Candidatus Zixiibacteriota bacterium]